jgi:hypothetical protein
MSPAVITRRCNPYGHESGGPRHLLGGVYGPQYEGQYHWVCESPATHRVRMHCVLYGHSGPVMEICDQHHAEIQKRQAGLCTRCAYPPEARSCQEEIEAAQAELQRLVQAGWHWQDPKCSEQRHAIERGKVRMDELWTSGRIRSVPMKLEEIA